MKTKLMFGVLTILVACAVFVAFVAPELTHNRENEAKANAYGKGENIGEGSLSEDERKIDKLVQAFYGSDVHQSSLVKYEDGIFRKVVLKRSPLHIYATNLSYWAKQVRDGRFTEQAFRKSLDDMKSRGQRRPATQ